MSSIIPKISESIKLLLLGCNYYGDPFHSAEEWSEQNEIGNLWKRFIKHSITYSFLLDKLNIYPKVGFEVHFESDDFQQTRKFEVFVGIAVEHFNEIPIEFVVKSLPETKYAIVTTKANDYKSIDYIFNEWLKSDSTGFKQVYPYIIEYYHQDRFKSMDDPESEIDWWIPIAEVEK